MADIKQAAKWIDEGRQVRRPFLMPEISLGSSRGPTRYIAVFTHGKRAHDFRLAPFNTEDLLADDWEVVE